MTIQGVELFVHDSGSGLPVLLLHGNPDSADIWEEVLPGLSGRYRCIVPDLPGFGRSEAPRYFDFSFENLGQFVDEVMNTVGISEPVHLVAHDFGGAFGMAWAILHPERVRTLTVINHPFFVGDYRWHTWARIWRTPVVGELSMLLMNWPLFRRSIKQGSRTLSEERIRRAYAFLNRRSKRSILRLYRAANPPMFRQWEQRMLSTTAAIPTLVLWGRHDPYIPRWVSERFGATDVVEYADSGHWAPAEVPERVTENLLQFFAQHSSHTHDPSSSEI